MGPRAGLSTVLLLGSVVLLIAIAVGNGMGSRVLRQIGARVPEPTIAPYASPTAGATDAAAANFGWKRVQVISVATDPGFPDPRITPEPEPTATPRKAASPSPRPSTSPTPYDGPPTIPYTSPPLPLPLVSHGPSESPGADIEATVPPSPSGSGTPKSAGNITLPPVNPATLNP